MAESTQAEPRLPPPAPEAGVSEIQPPPEAGAEAGGAVSGDASEVTSPPKAGPATVERASRGRDRNLKRSAQAFFAHANDRVFDLLYSMRKTTAPAEEGLDPEPIPEDKLSFAVLARDVAEGYYGLPYGDAPFGKRKQRERETRQQARTTGETIASRTVVEQSLAAHAQARDIARAVLQELFGQKKQQLDGLVERMQTKAEERSPEDPAKYLKSSVKRPHDDQDRGGPLEARIRGAYKSLEQLRLFALDDVMDWYRQRVSQVEAQIQDTSLRKSAEDNIADRIMRVEQSTEIAEALNQLDMDYELIAEIAEQEPIAPQDKDKAYFTRKLKSRAAAAERMRTYVNRSLERMREVLNTNRSGRNQVEAQADCLREGIVLGADFFIPEARRQMIGLSPEGERNFLEAINELFDDVGGEITGRPDSTERRARAQERWRAVNGTYHLVESYMDGKVQRQRLVRAAAGSEIKVGEDHVPQNVDELLARAKQEAILLGQLRQKMRRTFAIMGPAFAKLVRAELKGMPNADKIEAVEYMNGVLSAEQGKALKALGEDADFKAGLAGRELKELKWYNKADQPFITQVRQKVYGTLELGAVDKPNGDRISALFEAPADEATVAQEKEAEAEQVQPESILRKLLNGKIDPVVLATVYSPEDQPVVVLQEQIKGEFVEINKATHSAPFREAMLDHFDSVLRSEGLISADSVKEIMRQLTDIRIGCESLARVFGTDWPKLRGILVADPEQAGKFKVNIEPLIAAFTKMADENVNFIQGLQLDSDESVEAFFSKLDKGTRERLQIKFGLSTGDIVFLVTYGLPGQLQALDFVDPTMAMKRIGNYLELGAGDKKGVAALESTGLVSVVKDEQGEIVTFSPDKIDEVIRDTRFDRRA